jgi:hypothetical protein
MTSGTRHLQRTGGRGLVIIIIIIININISIIIGEGPGGGGGGESGGAVTGGVQRASQKAAERHGRGFRGQGIVSDDAKIPPSFRHSLIILPALPFVPVVWDQDSSLKWYWDWSAESGPFQTIALPVSCKMRPLSSVLSCQSLARCDNSAVMVRFRAREEKGGKNVDNNGPDLSCLANSPARCDTRCLAHFLHDATAQPDRCWRQDAGGGRA